MKTFQPNREELAWAAGFYDGEGYCGMQESTQHNSATLHIYVSQVHRAPLERFQAAVGGLGNISKGYKNGNKDHYKPLYVWRVGSRERSFAVVAMLWHFLGQPKKDQITAAAKKYHSFYSFSPSMIEQSILPEGGSIL